MIIERGNIPPEALQSQPQKGYQEMKVIMPAGADTVLDSRTTGYKMTEDESKIIDAIKARFDNSFELDEADNTACFDYHQERLRQIRIDKAVDDYLTPENNKPKRLHQEDSKQPYLDSTDIACIIMSAVMWVVLIISNLII